MDVINSIRARYGLLNADAKEMPTLLGRHVEDKAEAPTTLKFLLQSIREKAQSHTPMIDVASSMGDVGDAGDAGDA